MLNRKVCWVFGVIAILMMGGCSEKSSTFIEPVTSEEGEDAIEEEDGDVASSNLIGKDSQGLGSDTTGDQDDGSGNSENSDTAIAIDAEDTDDNPWANDEDTAIVVTEDGGVGGSGIYPPKEIPESLGGDRPAEVVVPLDYDENTAYPLVLNLHAYTGNGEQIENYFNLSAFVTSKEFVLVSPEGTIDPDGYRFWNSPDCCNKFDSDVDDLTYLVELIEEAKSELSIDSERVYLVGYSNGGFMAHYVACQYPETISAIASLAGVSPKSPADCSPESSVGILQIHGTLDSMIPFDGTFFYNSANQTVANWRNHNACDEGLVTEEPPENYDYLVPGKETVKTSWKACGSGNSVSLWALQLSAHVPYLHPGFTPDVLDWLFSQTNQASSD